MLIKDIVSAIHNLPVEHAVLLRGETGVGKSEVVRQFAVEQKLPLLDVRLGQLTEGDILGLPRIVGDETVLVAPDWLRQACDSPVVLHFDELNRALGTVLQGIFQVILDRCMGAHRLHPLTRVFASINVGNHYQVNDLDPALQNRFWVVDFTPSVSEFLSYAERSFCPTVYNFIRKNQSHIEPSSIPPPGKVVPSRRNWARLDQAVRGFIAEKNYAMTYLVAIGYIGLEGAMALSNYVEKNMDSVSADDVIARFKKDMLSDMTPHQVIELANAVGTTVGNREALSEQEVFNLAAFVEALTDETSIVLWRILQEKKDYVEHCPEEAKLMIVDRVRASRKKAPVATP